MDTLGRIEKILDLRTVWSHERYDFSKWLVNEQPLKMLSDAIGIDIVLEELESTVGNFSVDIFASEEGTNRKIIIENQLGDTDHDHLGKIITYASGKEAQVVIWIVKNARDEHRLAIEWLNQHTDSEIGFFLIEIELWKINDSPPAPKFNVVERPNDWAKTMKVIDSLSDTKKLQLEFWHSFNNYAFSNDKFNSLFSKRKASPQHWYDLSIGNSSYHISLTANTQKHKLGAEIYINDDKDMYNKFKKSEAKIAEELSVKIEWKEAKKDSRILILKDGDIKNKPDDWNAYFDWFCEMSIKLKNIAKKYDV